MMLFFAAVACLTIAGGIHDSIFNNFLSDTFSLSADQRGWLEFPRELPGLLVVLMSGILCMLPVTRVGMVAAWIFAAGMVGMAAFGDVFSSMLGMMILGSAGLHLSQPVGSSVILALSDDHNRGKRMGQAGAAGTIGIVLGTGLVWLFFDKQTPAYRTGFLMVAVMCLFAGAFYAVMKVPHLDQPRARLVVRKRFWLYYLLEFIFGARKQIFITFGPWVLIRVYGLPATSIAGLLMIAAIIGIVFNPLAGIAIDRFGERTVMICDGLVLAIVCIGYGYAAFLTDDAVHARWLACVCFVFDDLLFALGAARAIYLSRLAADPQELNATLALGVSVNHIASMTIPAVAGAVWVGFGYERVFLAAAVFALGISLISTRVPPKPRLRTADTFLPGVK